jgi:hypothetical protein
MGQLLKMKNGVRLTVAEFHGENGIVEDRQYSVIRAIEALYEGPDKTEAERIFAQAAT